MRRTRSSRILPTVAALALTGLLAAASPAAAACLSPDEARQAVAAGEAMRLGSIARIVGGDILNAELCEGGGGLVYRLAVMRDGGQVVTVVVDARSGQILN